MMRLMLGLSLLFLVPISGFEFQASDHRLWNEQSPILRPVSAQVSNLQSPAPNSQLGPGRLVYEEGFADPTSGWPASDEHDIAYAYTDGEYQIFVRRSFDWASAKVDVQLADYTVEADVRCVTSCGNYGSPSA